MPIGSRERMSVEVVGIRDPRFEGLLAEDDPLFREWLALWDAQPEKQRVAWSHPDWVTAWLDTYGRQSGRDFRLFFVRRDSALVGVFALRVVPPAFRTIGGWGLELLDDSILYGADPTLQASCAADAIGAVMQTTLAGRSLARGLTLRTVEADSPLLSPSVPAFVVPHVARSVIRLGSSHEAFMASLSRNFRGNLRKAGNRLRAAGDVMLEHLEGAEAVAGGLRRFATVEARSWKGRANSTMGGTPLIMALYERSLRQLAARGRAVIHVLTVNGHDVAAMLSVVAGGTLFTLKIGYDEAFAELSPGHMLLERVFREYCPSREIRSVNLLTNERWFESWRPETVQTYEVFLSRRGVGGALAAWLWIPWRKRVKRVLRRLRHEGLRGSAGGTAGREDAR